MEMSIDSQKKISSALVDMLNGMKQAGVIFPEDTNEIGMLLCNYSLEVFKIAKADTLVD